MLYYNYNILMTEGAAMKYKLDDYKVGEIAKFYGVSVDTVRFYDRKGVLKPEKKSDKYIIPKRPTSTIGP